MRLNHFIDKIKEDDDLLQKTIGVKRNEVNVLYEKFLNTIKDNKLRLTEEERFYAALIYKRFSLKPDALGRIVLSSEQPRKDGLTFVANVVPKLEETLKVLQTINIEELPNNKYNIKSLEDILAQSSVIERAANLTETVTTDQEGRKLKRCHEKERPYRSFSEEREKQILKQISTQFYFAIKPHEKTYGSKLEEVQTMHMIFSGKHFLFIAMNQIIMSELFEVLLKVKVNFQKMLAKQYENKGDLEGTSRSSRYANKLLHRVFTTVNDVPSLEEDRFFFTSDSIQQKYITEVLKNNNYKLLKIKLCKDMSLDKKSQEYIKDVLSEDNNTIYFVVVSVALKRLNSLHAEEILSAIADFAKPFDEGLYTCVAGKKRPCMGCFGRMQETITKFNKYPGRFWLHTIKNQTTEVADRTLHALNSNFCYVSLTKNNVPNTSYDTGSDSEVELSDISKRVEKLKLT